MNVLIDIFVCLFNRFELAADPTRSYPLNCSPLLPPSG